MSKAAKPLSMYCNAHTAQPLPMVKNKKPTMALFKSCFGELFLNFPVRNTKVKMSIAADTNRIPASRKGGNS